MMTLNYSSLIWAALAPATANHLWQSTAFLALAALLVWTLRKNQARVRYWLWLVASIKFLVPFSLLVLLGSHLAKPRATREMQPAFYSATEEVAQTCAFCRSAAFLSIPGHKPQSLKSTNSALPLIPLFLAGVWFCGFTAVLFLWCVRWYRISRACREATTLREGREFKALRRLEQIAGIKKPIQLVLSRGSLEPGIFGIFRPVLIWPAGISDGGSFLI
jgi:bla regulator protein blaR1